MSRPVFYRRSFELHSGCAAPQRMLWWAQWLCAGLAFLGCQSTKPPPQATHPPLHDGTVAMEILRENCLSCHNKGKQKGGLRLDSRESLLTGGDSGPAVDLKQPGKSRLLTVLPADADPHMPPKKQLTEPQIAALASWIQSDLPWNAEVLQKKEALPPVVLGDLPKAYHPAYAMAAAPDGKFVAGGYGNHIRIVPASGDSGDPVLDWKAHPDVVNALAWNPDSTVLISGSYREIRGWRMRESPAGSLVQGPPTEVFRIPAQHRVTALLWPRAEWFVSADSSPVAGGWIQVHEGLSGRILRSWKAHDDIVNSLQADPSGLWLASASADRLAKVWTNHQAEAREAVRLEGHTAAVMDAALNRDGTELATVGLDRTLFVWDLATKQAIVSLPGRKAGLNSVVWTADNQALLAGSDAGEVFRFHSLKRHTGEQSSAAAEERLLGNIARNCHVTREVPGTNHVIAADDDGRIFRFGVGGEKFGTNRSEVPVQGERKTGADPAQPVRDVASLPPSFLRDVLPHLAKAGCMAGACHARADGQNGFKLSVFTYDPMADHAEMTREARGRRVFPAAPEHSLLVLKPTQQVEHGGGKRFEPGSPAHRTLIEWIRSGMVYQHPDEPRLVRIEAHPHRITSDKPTRAQIRVDAIYSDGSKRDVTSLADYVSSDKEIVQATELGEVSVGSQPGESVVVARYLGEVSPVRVTIPSARVVSAGRTALDGGGWVDELAAKELGRLGLPPSGLCTDAEFLRRSALDTIGRLPTLDESRTWLAGPVLDRAAWVDHLLRRPEYADYWANKWADLLRPNPDRVGVKSIFVLDQWLRNSFRENKPYDQFAREIIEAEGSNHRSGPAVVYRDRREPAELTTMFAQLFLGVRMECAKCHHHPNEKWSQDDFYQLAAHFGRVKQKGNGLSPPISAGTEIFFTGRDGDVKHPVTGVTMKPRPPEGSEEETGTGEDPRHRLAQWMSDPKNPYLARAAVNRVWASFFGRGFVDPVDDFRVSNPPVHEPLLDALARDFVAHRYDYQHLIRTILNSRLYQLSSEPNPGNLADTRNFSRSYRRRLPAEVLLDAVTDVTGIDEEFTGCPPGTRAMQTWSYKVTSHFMDAFGRPNSSTDCPCERNLKPSVVQALHLMNSKSIQSKLANENGRANQWAVSPNQPEEIVDEVYRLIFSRKPTPAEASEAKAAFVKPGANRREAVEDLMWALLNSAEFVFNH